MRNSVKVVMDAYNGATTFYVFDSADPIIAAWRAIFPSLFKDASAMPQDLRRHVRYPELLLKLQAQVYGLYHMTDPTVFYNREDLWTVASEVGMKQNGEQAAQSMEPNFVLMKLPGQSERRVRRDSSVHARPIATTSSAGSRAAATARTTARPLSTTSPRPGWSTARCRSRRASTRTRSSPAS